MSCKFVFIYRTSFQPCEFLLILLAEEIWRVSQHFYPKSRATIFSEQYCLYPIIIGVASTGKVQISRRMC